MPAAQGSTVVVVRLSLVTVAALVSFGNVTFFHLEPGVVVEEYSNSWKGWADKEVPTPTREDAMTTHNDLKTLFRIHPDSPRIVGFGWNAGIVRETIGDDDPVKAIAINVQLLDPDSKEQSGKWLILQLQPDDAMILAKCILQVAETLNWPEPDAEIIRTRLGGDETRH